MAENNEVTEQQVQEPQTQEPQAPEVSEIEKKARAMGWRGRDAWNGPEEDFIDAAEFVRRKPLFDKIEYLNKKFHNLEEAHNTLVAHHAKVREIEYQRAIRDLQAQRREAMKEGDTVRALELEENMQDLTAAHQATQVPNAMVNSAPGPSPEFMTWVQYNPWYQQDKKMQAAADGLAQQYIREIQSQGRQLNVVEVLQYVEQEIKDLFPNKFENPNRNRPSAVSSGDRNGKVRASDNFTLTAEEEKVINSFTRGDAKMREQYIKELKEMRARGEY